MVDAIDGYNEIAAARDGSAEARALRAECERYRKALEWYATRDGIQLAADHGARARAALGADVVRLHRMTEALKKVADDCRDPPMVRVALDALQYDPMCKCGHTLARHRSTRNGDECGACWGACKAFEEA